MSHISDSRSLAWVTYMIPFQVIRPDYLPEYGESLEKINTRQYDHGILSKVVTCIAEPQLDQLSLLVSFDGGLALPVVGPYDSVEKAINRFNQVLCSLLVGGIDVEAIDSRHVVMGSLYKSSHVWPVGDGLSLDAHLHAMLRTQVASAFDAIILNTPKNVLLSEFKTAYEHGSAVLDNIQNLSPTFLLKGHTEFKYNNFSDALTSLWTAVEQLIDYMWQHEFLDDPQKQIDTLPRRNKSLREDSRTWSLAVRQEILWQVGIISKETYKLLFPARQARNSLIHSGKPPSQEIVSGLYEATIQLMEHAGNKRPLGMRTLPAKQFSPLETAASDQSFEDWKELCKKLYT
jgi:hypothetical protein